MSVLKIEGFEKYSSLNDILSHYKYANYQTPVILSSTDTTGVIPRNNLSCLKMTSTQTQLYSIDAVFRMIRFPKFAMQEIPLHTNGILGFSYYSYVPPGGSFAPFTPIATVCDPTGRPHFFICVNGSRQIELRRWNTSASMGTQTTLNNSTKSDPGLSAANVTWDVEPNNYSKVITTADYCRDTGSFVREHFFSSPTSTGWCNGTINITYPTNPINASAFTLVHTSTAVLNASSWNYIEVEYVVSSSSTGSFKLRINNLPSDNSNTIDSQVTNVATTTQSNGNVGQVAFGTFWAHRADGLASFYSDKAYNTTTHWITYFDDIYLLRKDSTSPNNFLGSVSCLKGDFDTLVSNTASSGNLASISDATISASGHMSNKLVINNYNQNIQAKCANLAVADATNIKFVQPVVLGYDLSSVPLKVRATLDSGISDNEMVLESNTITGNAKFGPALVVDPNNNTWTGSNLKNTTFLFGA
jgi:hypothetical protein